MPKVIFSPRAEHDLLDILTDIAEHNPNAALKYVDGIEEICRSVLCEHPRVGRNKHDFPEDFLMFPYRNHIIIYEIGETSVDILRVVHGARDLRNLSL